MGEEWDLVSLHQGQIKHVEVLKQGQGTEEQEEGEALRLVHLDEQHLPVLRLNGDQCQVNCQEQSKCLWL